MESDVFNLTGEGLGNGRRGLSTMKRPLIYGELESFNCYSGNCLFE